MTTTQLRTESTIMSEIEALRKEWNEEGKTLYNLRQDLYALNRQIASKEESLDYNKNLRTQKWKEIDELPEEARDIQ